MVLKSALSVGAAIACLFVMSFYCVSTVFAQQPSKEDIQRAQEQFRKAQEQRRAAAMRERDEYLKTALPQVLAPAELSLWLEGERKFLVDLVVRAKPKVLVVPPFVPADAMGVDITSRITIARQVARLIEAEAGSVPDPAIVFRALGEPRNVAVDDIRRQFARSSAEWLITGSATHDSKGAMRIVLMRLPLQKPVGADTPAAAFEKDRIEFNETMPPELAFTGHAAEAVRALGYNANKASAAKSAKAGPLVLPKSLQEAATTDAGTLDGVWMQQLIGILHLPYEFALPRPQERVFERTLAALLPVPRESPDYSVLTARAFAYLDRRSAALRILEQGKRTPEERALAAYLNADLLELGNSVKDIKRPVARLISELELLWLQHSFGMLPKPELNTRGQALVKSVPEAWQPLVAYYVLGVDLWRTPPATSVKLLLDKNFPVAGYGAEDIVRGKQALGASPLDERTEVEFSLSPLVHARKWREMNMDALCCETGSANWRKAQRSQFLDLLESDAERLAVAQIDFLSSIQGLPDRARQRADLYDEVLFNGGNPGVVFQRLLAAMEMFRKRTGNDQLRLAAEIFEHARKLLTWETAQNVATAHALQARNYYYRHYLATRGPVPPISFPGLPPHATEGDYPRRWQWSHQIAGGLVGTPSGTLTFAASRDACANTIAVFQPCQDYIELLIKQRRKAEADQAMATLVVPRFMENLQRSQVLAQAKRESGDIAGARALLEQAVRTPHAPLRAYQALGDLLREEGEFNAAAKTYSGFPGLSDPNQNPVVISNYLGRAGYGLAMRGAMQDARPLLRGAAANNDGSYRSLWSAGQLALTDGQYQASMATFQSAYQRYGEPSTVRLIASMLFMLGQQDAAWSVLRDVLPRSNVFAPYRAAVVGARTAKLDAKGIADWATTTLHANSPEGGPVFRGSGLVANAIFQTVAIDRGPESIETMHEVEKMLASIPSPRSSPNPPQIKGFQSPSYARDITVISYVAAYLAYKKGNHAQAAAEWAKLVRDFDESSTPPRIAGDAGSFWRGMQYYAFSLAKSGRVEEARNLPERITIEKRPAGSPKPMPGISAVPMPDFERRMIAGMVAAFAGKHAEAETLFRRARGSLPEPGSSMIPPEYAYVEVLEAVSAETGHRGYLQLALKFASDFQQYEPWAAWAYAFEAEHAGPGDQRIRAAATALKLDPESQRLSRLDGKTIELAREWLRRNDPFKATEPGPRTKL